MGAPTDPSSQAGGASQPGLAFVAAWAALVRQLETHAADDAAVGVLVSTALRALEACGTDEPLRVQFAPGEVHVGGEDHDLAPGSETALLSERLEACGLSGALFEAGLRPSSLVALAQQLVEGARRAAHLPALEPWSGEPVEHVHVLQRRFEDLLEGAWTSDAAHLRRLVEALPEGALDDPQLASEQVLELVRGDAHAGWDDDAAALQVELSELPAPAHDAQLLEPLGSLAETLGAELHQLVELDDEAGVELVQPRLAQHVRRAGAEERAVLASYLAPLRGDAPDPAGARHRRRLTGFVFENDLSHVLAEHDAFDLELALSCFPHDLGLWLDGLDLERADGHAQACALFERIGAERVLEAGQVVVVQGRLADPARAAALLDRPHPALVPVARLLLARGVPRLMRQVARFVRALAPADAEAAPLELLDDDELPAEVLAGLLDPPRTDATRAALRRRVAECLCDHLEHGEDDAGRRLLLARALADYPEARARLTALRACELAHGGDARLADELTRILAPEDAA